MGTTSERKVHRKWKEGRNRKGEREGSMQKLRREEIEVAFIY